ncbi:MAG: class I SAM-dependent methyltransferase [Variovorax sp.]
MANLTSRIQNALDQLAVPLALELPDGRRLERPGWRIRLGFSEWSALAQLASRQIGAVGEAYVEGLVRIEGSMRDVTAAIVGLVPRNPVQTGSNWLARLLHGVHSRRAHTQARDAAQIEFHYDVSDDFYALWLDPKRVYSCAYFRSPDLDLAAAQEAKIDHICRKLMLAPGQRFLDIGCGWGGLLLWAAEHYGVDATGITLSKNQQTHVQELIEAKGLQGRVRVQLCDYRALPRDALFDRISSVGMFEHVGRANMATYFDQLHALLAPGGLVLNHGITTGRPDHLQLGAGMGQFIDKYIFPGGELLHVSEVLHEMAAAGLEMVDTENLRPHYARTLWAWSDALEAHLPEARAILQQRAAITRVQSDADPTDAPAAPLPVDASDQAGRILRAYRLYLAGSAMSFEQGWIALHQMLAIRPDEKVGATHSVYPFVRDYMYPHETHDPSPCSIDSSPKPLPMS